MEKAERDVRRENCLSLNYSFYLVYLSSQRMYEYRERGRECYLKRESGGGRSALSLSSDEHNLEFEFG